MRKSPDLRLIQEAARTANEGRGLSAHFIEKDWFVTELLRAVMAFDPGPGLRLVFTGGTSLSKARGLLQTFSEDVDFVVAVSDREGTSRPQRSSLRERLMHHLTQAGSHFWLARPYDGGEAWMSRDESRFFSIKLAYPHQVTEIDQALRPYIQLEVTFLSDAPRIDEINVSSILDTLAGNDDQFAVPCKGLLEIAGDKLSALTWRILSRDRSTSKFDSTILRHLHDLAILRPEIEAEPSSFATFAMTSSGDILHIAASA